jgi:hypothetical protein
MYPAVVLVPMVTAIVVPLPIILIGSSVDQGSLQDMYSILMNIVFMNGKGT